MRLNKVKYDFAVLTDHENVSEIGDGDYKQATCDSALWFHQ